MKVTLNISPAGRPNGIPDDDVLIRDEKDEKKLARCKIVDLWTAKDKKDGEVDDTVKKVSKAIEKLGLQPSELYRPDFREKIHNEEL